PGPLGAPPAPPDPVLKPRFVAAGVAPLPTAMAIDGPPAPPPPWPPWPPWPPRPPLEPTAVCDAPPSVIGTMIPGFIPGRPGCPPPAPEPCGPGTPRFPSVAGVGA